MEYKIKGGYYSYDSFINRLHGLIKKYPRLVWYLCFDKKENKISINWK
jgi:hypothetical protein